MSIKQNNIVFADELNDKVDNVAALWKIVSSLYDKEIISGKKGKNLGRHKIIQLKNPEYKSVSSDRSSLVENTDIQKNSIDITRKYYQEKERQLQKGGLSYCFFDDITTQQVIDMDKVTKAELIPATIQLNKSYILEKISNRLTFGEQGNILSPILDIPLNTETTCTISIINKYTNSEAIYESINKILISNMGEIVCHFSTDNLLVQNYSLLDTNIKININNNNSVLSQSFLLYLNCDATYATGELYLLKN